MIALRIPKFIIKIFFSFFSLRYIRMSGNNINFDGKKSRKSTFYKNKTIDNIEDIDVNNILVSKKQPYSTKNSLKSLLHIMIMM